MTTNRTEVIAEAMRATPPTAVLALTVGDITLQDWVLLLTIVYVVLQIAYLLFRWVRLASQPARCVDEESGE